MRCTISFVVFIILLGTVSAMSVSLTSNRSYADAGQNLTLQMSATGGVSPYSFSLYPLNGSLLFESFNHGAVNHEVLTRANVTSYILSVTDSTGKNVTNETLSLQINATPTIFLHPGSEIIVPYSNITFTNTIKGGTPPFKFSYGISGGPYNRTNNTVEFNGISEYFVNITGKDALGVSFTSPTSVLNAAFQPTSITLPSGCIGVYNMSSTENTTVQAFGMNVNVADDYITPDYTQMVFNGNTAILNLSPYSMASENGYYAKLINLSWAPILHTVSVELCQGAPPTTSTTSTTSTSTSSLSTTSILPGTTTTILVTTTTTTTVTKGGLSPLEHDLLGVTVIIIVIVIIFLLNKRFKKITLPERVGE